MPTLTYDTLVSTMQTAQEDSSPEYLAYIPTAISNAEVRLTKELDTNFFKQNIQVVCSAGDRFITKPDGYHFAYTAHIYNSSSGEEQQLRHMPDDFIRAYCPNPTTTGTPLYYATDYNQGSFLLGPAPSSSKFSFRANIQADLDPLSAGNQTNYFTVNVPDVLYFASMTEQMLFSKDLDKMQAWEAKYINAVQGANNDGSRERQNDGDTKSINDAQNTLKTGQD